MKSAQQRVSRFQRDPGAAAAPLVEHRRIADPETGGRYTVKLYTSEKTPNEEGGWLHTRITLRPDTDLPGFEPIVIEVDEGDSEDLGFRVVAEFLAVLEK